MCMGPHRTISETDRCRGARDPRRFAVDADGIVQPATVAASDGNGDGDSDLATQIDHHGISSREPVERERESPEPIAFVRVGSREIKHEVGCGDCHHARERIGEKAEVFFVARSIAELDIEAAGDFLEG